MFQFAWPQLDVMLTNVFSITKPPSPRRPSSICPLIIYHPWSHHHTVYKNSRYIKYFNCTHTEGTNERGGRGGKKLMRNGERGERKGVRILITIQEMLIWVTIGGNMFFFSYFGLSKYCKITKSNSVI